MGQTPKKINSVETRGNYARLVYAALTLVLFVSLLAPTILCAVPTASMNTGEHECCKQMKEKCGDPSMSACCTIVPNTAAGTITVVEKSKEASGSDIQHAVMAYEDIVLATRSAFRLPPGETTSSPPISAPPNSLQVLRI